MTLEEASNILKGAIKKPNTKDGYLGQAITMGVNSLEAWEKVKAEIERNAFSRYASNYDLGLCRALDIIDKHLQDVESEVNNGK